MSAAVLVESTQAVASTVPVAVAVPTPSEVLVGHDAARERELDLMAANVENAAEGVAIFLLLALFAVVFVVATLTGVLA